MSWLPKQKIVVPVDFSESSADAVKTALELVARPEDLHVIYVILPVDYLSPGAMLGVTDESEAHRIQSAQTRLDEFLARLGASACQKSVRIGDPGLDVTDYAKSIGADLIVISSHGYHGVKRFLLGSVAERVIRHAECGVLVLRRRDAE